MKRIGILGDIGSGKSYVAKKFGYPLFDADLEVGKIYKKEKKIFNKLKKELPEYFYSFPVRKQEVLNAILTDKKNLKKIIKIIHPEIRRKLNNFLRKNKNKRILILDIPLLLENKLNKNKDVLVYVQSNKKEISKRLKKRKNFNEDILKTFKKIQLPLAYKKKKSNFIIKNNFTSQTVKVEIKKILNRI